MKVYFAGSIRGATFDGKEAVYQSIIATIKKHCILLSEHAGVTGEPESLDDKSIYLRDMKWIQDSDVMIAEVTAPSLGVGYEIYGAEAMDIPVLCLYKRGTSVSAMITGNPTVAKRTYDTPEEAVKHVEMFLNTHLFYDTEDL